MKRRFFAVFLLGSGCAALAYAMQQEIGPVIPYQEPARVAEGAAIYEDHCASCHGAELEGEPDWRMPDEDGLMRAPPHDASGHTWHHPDALLFRITKLGTEAVVGRNYKSRMPGFGDTLSDDEILSVLAFIKSTWPERLIDTHNRLNRQGDG